MVERKSTSILVGKVSVIILISIILLDPLESFALGPPPPIRVEIQYDLDTATDFEEIKYQGPNWNDITEFVLKRGTIGTINLTVSSSETNKIVVADLSYGGNLHFNDGWFYSNFLPDGITYSFEPSLFTIPPRSNVSVIMHISAAPRTPIGSYNLVISLQPDYVPTEYPYNPHNYRTILTIIESTPPFTKSTVISPTTYVTETITYTSTSTTTITTITDQVAESSAYAWAISATAAATILSVILLRRNRK